MGLKSFIRGEPNKKIKKEDIKIELILLKEREYVSVNQTIEMQKRKLYLHIAVVVRQKIISQQHMTQWE